MIASVLYVRFVFFNVHCVFLFFKLFPGLCFYKILNESFAGVSGEIVDNNNRLVVLCGDNSCVEILELQAEGKKRTDSASYLRGNKIELGTVLGD